MVGGINYINSLSIKPIIIQDATEGVERIIVFTWQETQELFFKRNL